MEKRSKFALKADKSLKAMGAGERTSKKVSTIRKADGTSFKRRNANQYVDAGQAGGNEYTEKRVNRTDRFNTGGTADSSENGGADMGGTLGSSMMKKGGGLKGKQKNLDLNKNGKLDSEDFKMIRGKMKTGGEVGDNYEKMVKKLEKEFEGQDLWDDEILDEYEVKQFDDRTNPGEIDKFVNEKKKKFYVVPFDYGDDSYYYILVPKNKMKEGGSTKGFEYSIGGL